MHMADALISPAVGGTMTVVTGAVAVYCAKKVKEDLDQSKVPLMGVLGAFIFAAQMVNFSIPGTGSSGHLGGGMILTILLGPYAAFLVMASVLGVQALFFADGGLLALGANVFNLGFFPAFIAYPLIYRRIVGKDPGRNKLVAGAIAAAVVGLLLGAFGVVLETTASGISALPFTTFVGAMLPIHLAIGIVEGLVTAGVVLFVKGARPELLERVSARKPLGGLDLKPILVGLLIAAVVAGGALSWFASSNPDGLEWSIGGVTGSEELEGAGSPVHDASASLQGKTAFLPDYGFKDAAESQANAGTSTSGIVGGAITLGVAGLIGFVLKKRSAARTAA
ncbi:MAG: cobalamin biosynthesis protein CbiM [Actinobacteria bacterium HGW-Actinobacteria-1]|jgi:cobalt/nickel transport system permease protein|nr:MAG: cobalamin biosynthesis protein CbiM [Actinobacteria bacterium HGW-Actinobacteria-1]